MIDQALLRRYRGTTLVLGCAAATLLWAAFAPLDNERRELLIEIPKGAWARHQAHDPVQSVPSVLHLTLGVRDVLVLRNHDSAPQSFGPVLIMPGQEFRMPFEQVSETEFACTAHASGKMKIVVDPMPNPGLARIEWRLSSLSHALRGMKVTRPRPT